MNKIGKIMIAIWAVLAIASFVSAFWAPIFFKVLGLVFGGLNMIIILSWVIAYFQSVAAKKNAPTEEEIAEMMDSQIKEYWGC